MPEELLAEIRVPHHAVGRTDHVVRLNLSARGRSYIVMMTCVDAPLRRGNVLSGHLRAPLLWLMVARYAANCSLTNPPRPGAAVLERLRLEPKRLVRVVLHPRQHVVLEIVGVVIRVDDAL